MHNMVSHMDTYYYSHLNVKPDDLLVIILYPCLSCIPEVVNTLRPRQHGRHFADDSFKRIFLSENIRISIKISLKFVHTGPINNIPALVQIMAWRRPGDKPLSEPMLGSLLTHICVTRPQWVKCIILLAICKNADLLPSWCKNRIEANGIYKVSHWSVTNGYVIWATAPLWP